MTSELLESACRNCQDWPDAREGLSKYDGYCATCFKRLFPEDARSLAIQPQCHEMRVRDAILTHFKGRPFVFDRPLYVGGCDCSHRRRIDSHIQINGSLLAIEVDEFAHVHYDQEDEKNRYDDIFMAYSGKTIYIRFNPDISDIEDRIKPLMAEIAKQLCRMEIGDNKELVEIIYMFYPKQVASRKTTVSDHVCPKCSKSFSTKYVYPGSTYETFPHQRN